MTTPRIISRQLSSKLALYHVQLIEPSSGKSRVFCLYEGIPPEEVRALYEASFEEVRTTAGLRDENGIYYPASLLGSHPQVLTGHKLMIVGADADHAEAASNAGALLGVDSNDTLLTEEQVQRSFHLLDMNGDNRVHREEFIEFMSAAFAKLLEHDAGLAFAYSCLSPREIAIATATQCYQHVQRAQSQSTKRDLRDSGANRLSYYLDFDDFCAWYMSLGFDPLRDLAIRAIEFCCTAVKGSPASKETERALRRSKSRTQLDLSQCYRGDEDVHSFVHHCQDAFFLGKRQSLDLIRVLSGVGKSGTMISKPALKKLVLSHIQHVGNHSPLDHYTLRSIDQLIGTLVEIAAEEKEQHISLAQAVSLFSLCAEEHSLETFAAIFHAHKQSHTNNTNNNHNDNYDNNSNDNSNKFLHEDEDSLSDFASSDAHGLAHDLLLHDHLLATLRLLAHFNPEFERVTGCTPTHLAHAIFTKLLLSSEVKRRQWGKLTLAEFVELYVHGLRIALSVLHIHSGFFADLLAELVGFHENIISSSASSSYVSNNHNRHQWRTPDTVKTDAAVCADSIADETVSDADAAVAPFVEMSPSLDSLEDDQVVSNLVSYSGSVVTLAEARGALGLFEYATYDVVKYLLQLCDIDENTVSQQGFNRGVLRLIGEHYIELTVLQRSVADFIFDRLSMTFDAQQKGQYSVQEIATALLLFCEDDESSHSRAEVILALQKNKVWRFSAVVQVAAILFKACYCLNPAVHPLILAGEAAADARALCLEFYMREVGAVSLENAVASESAPFFSNKQFVKFLNFAMQHLEKESARRRLESDIQSNANLSESPQLTEYRSKTPQSGTGQGDEEDALSQSLRSFSDNESEASIPYLDDEQFPPSATVLELRAAASVLGLERYSADDLIDKLGGESTNGWLTAKAWAKWFSKVIQQTEVSEYDIDIAIFLSNRIFAAFTAKENPGQVQFARIAAGLSVLCSKSPLEERLMVAFTLLDDDSDGFISFEQLTMLIHSVLLVVSVCSRIVSSKILSIEATIDELALAAAAEAMGTLGLQREDEITLEMLSDVSEDFLKLASVV